MQFLPTDIDRREWSVLGRDEFRRSYSLPLRPVIVTGGIDHWAARGTWTPEFFSQRFGSRLVTVDGRDWRLDDLVNEIRKSTPDRPAPYLRNLLLSAWAPELLADVTPMPDCTRPNWLESRGIPSAHDLTFIEFYLGGAGAVFPVLHYDNLHTHAFLMQLYGEKEYLALAPDQAKYLYPQDGDASNKSRINDLENPDLSRFPLFARAEGIRFKLRPGETLFVPAGWWHTARILSTSITVSINGVNQANWQAFRRDLPAYRGTRAGWRAALLQTYLVALGAVLRLKSL